MNRLPGNTIWNVTFCVIDIFTKYFLFQATCGVCCSYNRKEWNNTHLIDAFGRDNNRATIICKRYVFYYPTTLRLLHLSNVLDDVVV